MSMHIERGWGTENSSLVAELYEEAFGPKFCRAIPGRQKRIDVLSKGLVPEFSFAAVSHGRVVGLAGFQGSSGSLTGGIDAGMLMDELGYIHGLWACLVLSVFERKPENRELVMDGIVVDGSCRGKGLGSQLLDKIIAYASEHHYDSVRLDVIDGNPRARKLYESKGFVAVKSEQLSCLKWLVGFSGSTTMKLNVSNVD